MREKVITMSDACALLGIAPQTMRLYESYNEDTLRYETEENGYRSFSVDSLAQLFTFRDLTKLGISLRKSMGMVSDMSLDTYFGALESCGRDLEQERCRLGMLQDVLAENERLGRRIPECGAFFWEPSPDFWLLRCERDNRIVRDRAGREVMQAWSAQIPFVRYAPFVEAPFDERSIAALGLGVPDRFSCLVPLDSERVVHVSSRECLVGVVRLENASRAHEIYGPDNNSYYGLIERGLSVLKERGVDFAGTVCTWLIASNIMEEDGSRSDYYLEWFYPEPLS